MKTYKVIVWGLGNVGRAAVRMISEKKSLQLVGAIDLDPKKVGRDAGEIFGFAPTGVLVSDDIDAVLDMDADVVLNYTALTLHEDGRMAPFWPSALQMCRAMRRGKNVITTLPLFYSQGYEHKTYAILETCAKENGVTFTPTGLLPGAYASYIPMVVGGLMGRIDRVIIESGEDDETNTSSWLRVFGYGQDPEDFDNDRLTRTIEYYYSSAVYEMGYRLGLEFDEVKTEHKVFTAPVDLMPACGPVKKGSISAHYFDMSGYVDGEPKVSLRYVHKLCDKLAPEPPIRDLIRLEGMPAAIECSVEGMMPLDETYVTSAAPTINIIPQVVNGEAGYVLPMDLPVVIPIK